MNETTPSLFQEVKLADLSFNPFTLIDKEWMLIASGDSQAHNAMTASWGGLGVLWKTYVSFIFVRPQRFSMQFLEKSPTYSLCFFDKVYRPALRIGDTSIVQYLEQHVEHIWMGFFDLIKKNY